MGSIPFPNIPQDAMQIAQAPQNALAEYARVAQLKQATAASQQQMQQSAAMAPMQQQAAQQQIEMQRRQMADQDALTKTLSEYDPEKHTINDIPKLITKNGGSGQSALQAQQGLIKQRQDYTKLSDEQFSQEQKKQDLIQGVHDEVSKAPEDQKQTLYSQGLQRLQAAGIDTSKENPQYPGDAEFAQHLPAIRLHSAILEDANKERELKAKETAEQLKAEEFKAKMPGGPLADVGREEMADWIKKNPGKGPSDYVSWKAKQAPLAQINVANAAGGGMQQDAVDQAAEMYHLTGKLPPGGRGVAGLAQNRRIMNRAAELYPGSMAEGTAEYAANKQSLSSIQKQFDQVTAFENTAGKNLDTFLDSAKKVVDFGSPLINMPLRKAASLVGGEDQAAFNAARTTALTEIAKVLSSANAGSGVLSDSARKEVEGLIGADASLKQIYSAAQILKKDMGNRHDSYQQQIKDIQGRLGGKKAGESSAPEQPKNYWDKFSVHQ